MPTHNVVVTVTFCTADNVVHDMFAGIFIGLILFGERTQVAQLRVLNSSTLP